MKKQTNLKKDTALKDHFKNKQNFADITNAALFKGRQVIQAENLHDYDTDMATIMSLLEIPVTFDRNRDVIMKADLNGIYVLLAVENQSAVDYTMPLRVFIYDACAYNQQYQNMEKLKEKGLLEGSIKLMPIYTLVLYYGEKKWTAPTDLHGMMVDIPEELKPHLNNWFSNIVDGKENSLALKEKDNQDLFNGLQRLYQWNGDLEYLKELKMTKATAAVLASLAGNDEVLKLVEEEKGDEIDMYTSVDRAFKKEFERGKLSLLTDLLNQRFGSLSNQTIANLETSSPEKLDELSLNIFNLVCEDDINKLLLN